MISPEAVAATRAHAVRPGRSGSCVFRKSPQLISQSADSVHGVTRQRVGAQQRLVEFDKHRPDCDFSAAIYVVARTRFYFTSHMVASIQAVDRWGKCVRSAAPWSACCGPPTSERSVKGAAGAIRQVQRMARHSRPGQRQPSPRCLIDSRRPPSSSPSATGEGRSALPAYRREYIVLRVQRCAPKLYYRHSRAVQTSGPAVEWRAWSRKGKPHQPGK